MHLDYLALALACAVLCPRLAWPSRLRRFVSLNAAVLVVALCAFGAIAEDVITKDPLTLIDQQVEAWFALHRSSPLTMLMLGVSGLHGTVAASAATVVGAAALWRMRERLWLATLLVASVGGMLLNVALKAGFHRARPTAAALGPSLASFSFPSGHVDASTILYGFLCAYLFTRETSAATRWLVAAISLAMVACVAVSRMYLGVHYLSDVAAAFAEGIAWLALCLAVRERLEVSGATRPDAKPAISPAPR